MLDSFVQWLDQMGALVFWSCVALLLLVNGIAAVAFVRTKSRELVNRWTGRVLAANVLLIGTGVGVPAVTYVAKFASQTIAPMVTSKVAPAAAPKADVSNTSREIVPER